MDVAGIYPWIVRAAWAVLPFTTGPALADALDTKSVAVRTAASALLWGAWAATLCASLVAHPVSLTILRLAAPAALAAALWAATEDTGAGGLLAVAATLPAVALAYLPETGEAFVNGPAYPNERRFPLRVPTPLLFGPLALAWALTVGAPAGAVLLLAARQWVLGAVLAAAGAAAVFFLGRAIHGLSRRWVVFVPAGLVLHDPMSLADPVLFPKTKIVSLDPAAGRETGEALDLTQRAAGLALELVVDEAATLVLAKPGNRVGPSVEADRVRFMPTRPGRVLAEFRNRMG